MAKSDAQAEAEVRSWGFNHVFTWSDRPNAYYAPHTHSGKTTHLILRGELSFTYPDDADAKWESLGVGGRWDVDANRRHEVKVGGEGCTYVIGE